MSNDDPSNPYAAPEATPGPGPPGRPRKAATAAEMGVVAFIVTGLAVVLAAGVQNARNRHGDSPFLSGWVLRLVDRNRDGDLNVHDDPVFVASALLLPPLAGCAAAGGFQWVRGFLARARGGQPRC